MTRLANIEKAGYYPLPPTITDLILTYIAVPENTGADGRILDPCAGEGTALVTLADKLGLEPFGVELHEERAEKARVLVTQLAARRLTHSREAHLPNQTRLLNDSYSSLLTSRDGYNLLYVNPPYDWDKDEENGDSSRLEYQWLWRMRPFLQPGGLLVYVVPRHLIRRRKVANYIDSHFENVRVYRFPDAEYAPFKQIVLFGTRRRQGVVPNPDKIAQLMAWGREDVVLLPDHTPLATLTAAPEPLYSLPPLQIKEKAFTFRSLFVDPADAIAEARQVGAATGDGWRQHLDPTAITLPLRPLTPLKIGHMNSIIAAGHLNNQVLEEGNERLLIKGRSYKAMRESSFTEPLPDGGMKETTLETEVVVTDISTINSAGEIASHKGAGLQQFLTKWIGKLTAIVAADYPPVYQFNMNGYGDTLNGLSKTRLIPGLNGKSGLLPAQKHAAAAALTRLETHPDCIIVGEMGCGKSSLGAAIAAGLNEGRGANRTIILCPPHLVDKWQRECKAVFQRRADTPAVATMHLQNIGDVDLFFSQRQDGLPLIGVLKQTTARSASGWEHCYDYGGPASHSYGSKGFVDVKRPWGNLITADQLVTLKEQVIRGQTVDDYQLSPRQLMHITRRGVHCPTCGEQQMVNASNGGEAKKRPLSPHEMKGAKRFCSNKACRAPLFQFKRRRSASQKQGDFTVHTERERIIRTYTSDNRPVPAYEVLFWAGTRMKETFGYGKVPLAGYIKKRATGQIDSRQHRRLDLCLVDEQHQYKGDDSDQGYAMHHLALASQKIVGLTGTIYGGKASSIFHLLYRISPEMTALYTNPEGNGRRRIRSKDWVSAYGILQRIESRKLDENGQQTANSRATVRFKELPGGSPAMLPWLLNRSVFLSLRDMGFPLPPYTEIPVEVPMADEQAAQYKTLERLLKEELKTRLLRGDKSLLAGYLYALLFWPDSPRRAKVVRDPRTNDVIASIPGLPEGFVGPKEESIIDRCLEEKADGRKVLLLCLQTDTLDMQPEWKGMLEDAGLKASILRAAPNKREGWIEKQVAAGVDVVISHPKKVETGLDLLDFPTIIWMAPHYSVYTVLQASRRSWRIGQTQPVKVYYYAYAGTIQEEALYLVAAKVAAALRVNGDTVADDSLAELDGVTGDDIVATLARIVAGESKVNTQSLQQAFAKANADLRQADSIIGEYEIVDEPEMVEAEIEEKRRAVPLLVTSNGHHGLQVGLFGNGNGNGKSNGNGKGVVVHANGNGVYRNEMPVLSGVEVPVLSRVEVAVSTKPATPVCKTAVSTATKTNGIVPKEDADIELLIVATNGNGKHPPVPRPRLFIG